MPEMRRGKSVYYDSYKTRRGAEKVKKKLDDMGYPNVFIRKYKGMWDVRYD